MDVELDKGTVRDTTNNQAVDTEQKGMVWKGYAPYFYGSILLQSI